MLLSVSEICKSFDSLAAGIRVWEDDSDWRDALNYCLHDLWNSGQFQKIYAKWFGPDSMCPVPLEGRRMEAFVKG